MGKQIIGIIVASIVVVFGRAWVKPVLAGVVNVYAMVSQYLSNVFSVSTLGQSVNATLCLIVIPLVVTLVIAGIYRLVKKARLPGALRLYWVLWLVLAVMTSVMNPLV